MRNDTKNFRHSVATDLKYSHSGEACQTNEILMNSLSKMFSINAKKIKVHCTALLVQCYFRVIDHRLQNL